MRSLNSANWHSLAMTLNVLVTPGLGPTAALMPLLGLMGGFLKRLTH